MERTPRRGVEEIRAGERSGVLHPENLRTFHARWITPRGPAGRVVETYWHVRWALPDGERIEQTIVDRPAVTLSIESGDVVAPFVVTGPRRRAWVRTISGSGDVFAARLRPSGLDVLGGVALPTLVDAVVPADDALCPGIHGLLRAVGRARDPQARADVFDELAARCLEERPPGPAQRLADAVVAELVAAVRDRTGAPFADGFGVSERTVQRALRSTLGMGPKAIASRIRLQEVARLLAGPGVDDLARIAAELGYADQAHLVTDFRRTTGITPGAYRRSLDGRRS
ncbi:helix-turn-helix domain-containing protein [Isoptericola hypogeus]